MISDIIIYYFTCILILMGNFVTLFIIYLLGTYVIKYRYCLAPVIQYLTSVLVQRLSDHKLIVVVIKAYFQAPPDDGRLYLPLPGKYITLVMCLFCITIHFPLYYNKSIFCKKKLMGNCLVLIFVILKEPVLKSTITAKILNFYNKCQVRY